MLFRHLFILNLLFFTAPIILAGENPYFQAQATNSRPFYHDKERGWFWYEDPVDENEAESQLPLPQPLAKKETEKPVEKPTEVTTASKPLSAAWMRKNLEKYRDKAIDEPTDDNVAAYLYLQRVMLDKGEAFATVSQRVVMNDPLLDENTRRPLATMGAFAMDDQAQKGTDQTVHKLAKIAGLWFFYSSTCDFCIKEAQILKGLMAAYGFKVLAIALDGLPLPSNDFPNFTVDKGQGKSMGVETTPALFLVKPGTNSDVIQLSQGLLAMDEIVHRAITLAHEHHWLDDNEFANTLKVKPLQVDNKTIQSITETTVQDSKELVKLIKNNLRKQLKNFN